MNYIGKGHFRYQISQIEVESIQGHICKSLTTRASLSPSRSFLGPSLAPLIAWPANSYSIWASFCWLVTDAWIYCISSIIPYYIYKTRFICTPPCVIMWCSASLPCAFAFVDQFMIMILVRPTSIFRIIRKRIISSGWWSTPDTWIIFVLTLSHMKHKYTSSFTKICKNVFCWEVFTRRWPKADMI